MEECRYQLVLGSGSPRRKELLGASFLNFQIVTSDIEEVSALVKPEDIVIDLAKQKSAAVLDLVDLENPLIVGADTMVVLGDQILGKPKDKDHARELLKSLSGKTHRVLTGVCLLSKSKSQSFCCETKVTFKQITNDLLELYLDTGDSLDKAGAYGIQAKALSFIEKVEGSYSNVVGFPIDVFLEQVKKFVDCEGDQFGKWRGHFE